MALRRGTLRAVEIAGERLIALASHFQTIAARREELTPELRLRLAFLDQLSEDLVGWRGHGRVHPREREMARLYVLGGYSCAPGWSFSDLCATFLVPLADGKRFFLKLTRPLAIHPASKRELFGGDKRLSVQTYRGKAAAHKRLVRAERKRLRAAPTAPNAPSRARSEEAA